MERAVTALAGEPFDLLIVGAGVYGAALAWRASACGYRVAIIERADFAGGTSANSLKILHGGLRHLQQLDLVRMRSAVGARREWARLAARHVRPLPCVVASGGCGLRSRAALGGALLINELLSLDRNAGLPDACRLPPPRLLSRAQYAARVAGLVAPPRSGGALWWDALALDTERLVLELLARAADRGARVANQVEARGLLVARGQVEGVRALDHVSGRELSIEARRVVAAVGDARGTAWGEAAGPPGGASQRWCGAMNLVVERTLPSDAAVALACPLPAIGTGINAGRRDLFLVPWRGRTMIGTQYFVDDGADSDPQRRGERVRDFLVLLRAAMPCWALREQDIRLVHWGKLPLHEHWRSGEPPRLSAQWQLLDGSVHAQARGLWWLQGPKFTAALSAARRITPRIMRGIEPPLRAAAAVGCERELLQQFDHEPRLEARAAMAARDWQARTLLDVVLRRTGCGTAGHPGRAALQECAQGMARELGWNVAQIAAEIHAVDDHYRRWHFCSEDVSNAAIAAQRRAG